MLLQTTAQPRAGAVWGCGGRGVAAVAEGTAGVRVSRAGCILGRTVPGALPGQQRPRGPGCSHRPALGECLRLPPGTSPSHHLPPAAARSHHLLPGVSRSHNLPPGVSRLQHIPPGTSRSPRLPPGGLRSRRPWLLARSALRARCGHTRPRRGWDRLAVPCPPRPGPARTGSLTRSRMTVSLYSRLSSASFSRSCKRRDGMRMAPGWHRDGTGPVLVPVPPGPAPSPCRRR